MNSYFFIELVPPGSGRVTRHRLKRGAYSEEPYLNGDVDYDVGTRRSTRQRKLLYSTFNQKVLDAAVASSADEQVEEVQPPRRKRRRADVEPLEQDEVSSGK